MTTDAFGGLRSPRAVESFRERIVWVASSQGGAGEVKQERPQEIKPNRAQKVRDLDQPHEGIRKIVKRTTSGLELRLAALKDLLDVGIAWE